MHNSTLPAVAATVLKTGLNQSVLSRIAGEKGEQANARPPRLALCSAGCHLLHLTCRSHVQVCVQQRHTGVHVACVAWCVQAGAVGRARRRCCATARCCTTCTRSTTCCRARGCCSSRTSASPCSTRQVRAPAVLRARAVTDRQRVPPTVPLVAVLMFTHQSAVTRACLLRAEFVQLQSSVMSGAVTHVTEVPGGKLVRVRVLDLQAFGHVGGAVAQLLDVPDVFQRMGCASHGTGETTRTPLLHPRHAVRRRCGRWLGTPC